MIKSVPVAWYPRASDTVAALASSILSFFVSPYVDSEIGVRDLNHCTDQALEAKLSTK